MLTSHINRCHFLTIVMTAFILTCVGGAYAAPISSNEQCGIFLVGETASQALDAFMKDHKDIGAAACIDVHGTITSYSPVSPIWKRPFGVCEYEIASPRIPVPSSGFRFPPQTRMLVTNYVCPKQTDSRYISTSGISEGLFAAIVDFVERFHTSKEKFAKMFTSTFGKHASEYKKFWHLIHNGKAPHLVAIRLAEPLVDKDTFGYELVFKSSQDADARWFMTVDFTSQGLKIFSLAKHRVLNAMQ